jgi:hypothetical protein
VGRVGIVPNCALTTLAGSTQRIQLIIRGTHKSHESHRSYSVAGSTGGTICRYAHTTYS